MSVSTASRGRSSARDDGLITPLENIKTIATQK
jgi:hypothetical protein